MLSVVAETTAVCEKPSVVEGPNGLSLETIETPAGLKDLQTPVGQGKLPEIVRALLDKAGLPWYQLSIALPEEKVDPFFCQVARHLPGHELVLAGGSDLVQLVIGRSKMISCEVAEVNTLPIPAFGTDLPFFFHELGKIDLPPFGDREHACQAQVILNGESLYNLERMIENTLSGRYLADSPLGFLNVPIKHGYLAVVSEQGSATLFFRTEKDYRDFQNKLLTLPDMENISVDAWLASIDSDEQVNSMIISLHYAAVVYERARADGWRFDQASLRFLQGLSARLGPEDQERAISMMRETFSNCGMVAQTLSQTLTELGLIGVD